MNQTELMREALQTIETVLADAYHRRFAECCGRGQGECCGDFIEQWTPEDHKILDTLSPIQRQLSQTLATEPAPLARLTEDEVIKVLNSNESFTDDGGRVIRARAFANAIMDAMEAKGGTPSRRVLRDGQAVEADQWPARLDILQRGRHLQMTCNQNCRQGRDCNCAGWHVVPLNDLREHEANGSCWCKPTLDDGVWLHDSMNGRETFETGERLPS